MSVGDADPSLDGRPILAGTHWVIPMPGGYAGPMSVRWSGKMPRTPLDPLVPRRPGHERENPDRRR
jgi:hypothetical protein